MSSIRYFFETIKSKSYWQYILFSRSGIESIFAVFGVLYLFIEALDFFNVYTRDKYASYFFLILLLISIIISAFLRRPIKTITIKIPDKDFSIEVIIGNIFDVNGAVFISSNTVFEADVAGGKIAPDSLQGQFTARYFTGNQNELISKIKDGLSKIDNTSPYPIGTTIPINTHGKTFYFTAMAELNEQGNASTSTENVKIALDGLWDYIRKAGELQELVVPVIGTGRGRLKTSRKKMIALIAESFVKASEQQKFSDKLVIAVRPKDACKFAINLYDIKDNLMHNLMS